MKDLTALNEELDFTKNRLVEDLREMENQKAKLTLDRKNLLSACETLASKYNLESQQSLIFQGIAQFNLDRSREVLENIKKVEQNIGIYRKIIQEVEIEISLKKQENSDLQNEIIRRREKNKSLIQSAESI